MKKEHYEYISEHFNLVRYSEANEPSVWEYWHEGNAEISNLTVRAQRAGTFSVTDGNWVELFVGLPSQELALAIIDHIKNSEILFI